ncbi:hypothetical protein C8035_v010639 [Colletotrichum spinosum]|uniref:Uncharacterized protein n=1 Tax=Colletotrichum spinosum TaxID=1347390 RepID=A0A4R8PWL8_9PEZI|nr:hypothetical protein C8035_v010639 [Colletotrichum spinosum]
MNISLIKAIDNYEDYNYFYKGLNELVLYKSNFTIFPNFLKIVIVKFNFEILLINKAIRLAKKRKIKGIKKNLTLR